MGRPEITVCMMVRDEAATIREAIASVKDAAWCTNLMVCDTGSVDDTREIAREMGAQVLEHQWEDFTKNRKKMIAAVPTDWFFILDGDEKLTPELIKAIEELTEADFKAHPVMFMPRKNYILGRHVKAWDPDFEYRLVDKTRIEHHDHVVHHGFKPIEGSMKQLNGHLLHKHGYVEFSDYFSGPRYEKRVAMMAQEQFDQGKRIGMLGLWLKPAYAFFKFFILKGGFMDGAFGLLIAQKAAVSTQLKYAKLWALQEEEKNKHG